MKHTITDDQLKKVRGLLTLIAKRPDLPNPERDADWKNCQKWSAHNAKKALSILNTIEKQPESPWQTIESAPHGASGKPETYIMLSKQEQGTTLVCTGYRNEYGAYEWFGGGMMALTHWMPIPPPPSTPAQQAEAELIEGMHTK